ncbi:Patatin-like phospholipase [Gemmata sp. SH-PL17]|uniref:patatin-like phospholipase family protein n=1 Tax=Gemmata sp. SH-PL17 TaxID=1630693 RepID=UPI00078D4839|nr:patatin-like phospholipase family protein [Gemmata sp. SH-PL17]AMV28112.1 Patatin-like phospholipase [Gemmata sp. SH-PL17]
MIDPQNVSASGSGNDPVEPPAASTPPAAPNPPPPGWFRKLVLLGAATLEALEAVLRWLTAYPLFLVQLLVLLFAAWGIVGEDLGAEHLFWHERPLVQFGTGGAVGLFVGVFLFLNYILFRPDWLVGSYPPDPKRPGLLLRFPGTLIPSADAEVRRLGQFLLWGMLLVLALILVPKFIAAASAPPATGALEGEAAALAPQHPWLDYLNDRLWLVPFVIGYVLAGLFARVTYYFDERLRVPARPSLRDWVLDLRIVPPSITSPRGTPWDTVREYLIGRDRNPVPPEVTPLHGIATLVMGMALIILVGLLAVVYVLDHWAPGYSLTGLVSLVCLILIVMSMLYGFFESHFRIQRLAFIGGALVLLVWNSTDFFKAPDGYGKNHYKLQFPGLEGTSENAGVNLPLWDPAQKDGGRDVKAILEATSGYAEVYLIPADEPLQQMCERWQKQPGREKEKPKIVIVCTSGGGIRAAVWTGVVLNELEKDSALPGFRNHIRLITGASGGMVGATLYTADFENPDGFGEAHIKALAADSLTRTGQSLILRDMTWNTIAVPPWNHASWDRGRTLEWMWELNTAQHLQKHAGADWQNPWRKTFADLRVLERQGKRPSMIYSPLMVEDSRRLLISNLELSGLDDWTDLTDVSVATGPHGTAGRSAVEFHRLFPDLPPDEFRDYFSPGPNASDPRREAAGKVRSSADFRVATAARMNATFPVISPAVSLPTAPPRRLVDAGLYDNYGVNVAGLWLLKNKDAILKYTSGVALVQIRAFPLHDARNKFASFDPDTGKLEAKPPKGDLFADILASASAPAEALLSARANAAFFRNAEQIEVLHRAFNTCPGDMPTSQFFYTAWLELRRPAALNWYLTTTERDSITTAYKDREVSKQHELLRQWFGTGGKVTP